MSAIIRAILIGAMLLAASLPPAAAQSTLDAVRARGSLACGVNGELRGFSWHMPQGGWQGLDVDMCRAVAAAVLGDAAHVRYVPVTAAQRFQALREGRIDLLARNTTVTLRRGAEGAKAVAVNFYDGQGFAVPNRLKIENASQLAGGRICVERGTTHEPNLASWFGARRNRYEPVVYDSSEAMVDAFLGSRCLAMTADASALASALAARDRQADYSILPQTITREPLGPYVRHGDDQWAAIVHWSFQAMLRAEELELGRANAQRERQSNDPEVKRLLGMEPGNGKALGLDEDWAFNIVLQVGNYGESFDRNVGARSMLKLERGLNALWSKGGLMFPLPMR
jgi:general L-amino acid transport system substrate-binding protein